MTVRFSPHYPNNPYQGLLASALAELGCTVVFDEYAKADVLHIHWQDKWLGTPIHHPCKVWTCHNIYPHGNVNHRLAQNFVAKMDAVIVHNQYSKQYLQQHFKQNSTLIPHGHFIDCYNTPLDRDTARHNLHIGTNDRVLLHIGAIKPYKNTFEIIEQFKALKEPYWRLLIAGKPFRIDKQRLRNVCAEDERIILHDEFIPAIDIGELVLASDALILAYDFITTSGSAVLGMSYDLPIIAPNLAPLREMIKSGAFYERHLADALELWPLLGSGNKDYISQFTWPEIAEATLKVYEKALNK